MTDRTSHHVHFDVDERPDDGDIASHHTIDSKGRLSRFDDSKYTIDALRDRLIHDAKVKIGFGHGVRAVNIEFGSRRRYWATVHAFRWTPEAIDRIQEEPRRRLREEMRKDEAEAERAMVHKLREGFVDMPILPDPTKFSTDIFASDWAASLYRGNIPHVLSPSWMAPKPVVLDNEAEKIVRDAAAEQAARVERSTDARRHEQLITQGKRIEDMLKLALQPATIKLADGGDAGRRAPSPTGLGHVWHIPNESELYAERARADGIKQSDRHEQEARDHEIFEAGVSAETIKAVFAMLNEASHAARMANQYADRGNGAIVKSLSLSLDHAQQILLGRTAGK